MIQTTLSFGSKNTSNINNTTQKVPEGLRVIENFITKDEENELLRNIYQHEWSDVLKRRVQQYGYEYNYTKKDSSKIIEPLPEYTQNVCSKMIQYFEGQYPQQLIINEYTPGQGISPHVDAKIFGDTIISLSLGSICEFVFEYDEDKYKIFLTPRTLVVMSGESRHKWKHSIPCRKTDYNTKRGTRVSMTFRTLKV